MARWRTPIIAAILFIITFAVFARVLKAGFVQWDDDVAIELNDRLGSLSWERLAWAFSDVHSTQRYVPLTLLGWSLNCTLSGGAKDPWGFHLGNLLLHSASVSLAFLLLLQVFRMSFRAPRNATDDWPLTIAAMIGATLWGLHPMRVEVVAWATTRTYSQAMFFLLITMLCHLRFVDRQARSQPGSALYLFTLAAYLCSMLSYPLALMLPAVLVILDVYPLRQMKIGWGMLGDASTLRCLVQKVPFAAIAGIVLALGLWARFTHSDVFASPASLERFGILPRISQAFYLLAYYAWRPWWPVNLSPVRTDLVHFSPADLPFALSIVGVILVTAMFIRNRGRWPAALALWMFHIIALLPVLGWTEHPHYPPDRYSLWQGMAWPIAAAAAVLWLWRRESQRIAAIAASACSGAVVMVLAALSIRQTAIWHDSFTLFDHVIKILRDDPYRGDIHYRRAIVSLRHVPPDVAQAERDAAAGVAADPRHRAVRLVLARALNSQGRQREVIPLMQDGLKLDPESYDLRFFLGMALAEVGRLPEAQEQLIIVLRAKPDFEPARQGLVAVQQAIQQQQLQRR